MADTLSFFVLVKNVLVPIEVTKKNSIVSIFDRAKERDHRVKGYFEGLKPNQCQYFRFVSPPQKSAFVLEDGVIVTNKARVLQAYAKEAVYNFDTVKNIFPNGVPSDAVCLLLEPFKDNIELRLKLFNETLFNCLAVCTDGETWSRSDIKRNCARICIRRPPPNIATDSQPPEMQVDIPHPYIQSDSPDPQSTLDIPIDVVEMIARLSAPRRYTPNGGRAEARLDFFKKLLPEEFKDYFISEEEESSFGTHSLPIESDREFEYFARLTTLEDELASGARTECRPECISALATIMYIMPPREAYVRQNIAKYETGKQWPFYLFLKTPPNTVWKYQPKSDFSFIDTKEEVLFIIGEVESEADESDRWRMLCQAVALARLGSFLLKTGSTQTFVVMAVYVTKDLIAERYFVYQPKMEDFSVDIIRDVYDLKKGDEGRRFLREMYNYGEEMCRIEKEIDRSKFDTLKKLMEVGEGLKSWSSREAANRRRSSRGTSSASTSARSSGVDEEVFYRRDVQDALVELGFRPDPFISLDHPFVAESCRDDKQYYIKFLCTDRDDEYRILSFLSKFDSPHNPVVGEITFCGVDDGVLVVMADGGTEVTLYENLSRDLLSVALQFFEGVAFLHEKEVAHNDLKPSNIVVDETTGRVCIIDFNLAVLRMSRLDGRLVGTKGWTAPEVGGGEAYNPMRADVWAAGKVVTALCAECPKAMDREFLIGLAEDLMNPKPKKRPSMKDAVKCILSYMENKHVYVCGEST